MSGNRDLDTIPSVRIMFLNTWNGKQEGFGEYIASEAMHTHVFCLQEVYKETRKKCLPILTNYTLLKGYKEIKDLGKDDNFSQATYIRNDLKILTWSLVLKEQENTGLGVFCKVGYRGNRINICNIHGVAYPGDKLDSQARLNQSDKLLEFFADVHGPIILGGDLNLEPNTESIKRIERSGFRNLIREEKIPTTRNEIAWEKYPDSPQYFSDYVFVNPEVEVRSFRVSPELVSDHQPLILEIEG